MSVSEFQRHEVFKWLEEQMGSKRAAIMMDLLPPVGWSDIATKRDVEWLEDHIDMRFGELRAEVRSSSGELRAGLRSSTGELRAELHSTQADLLVKLFFGFVASNATLVGLVFAAVRLG